MKNFVTKTALVFATMFAVNTISAQPQDMGFGGFQFNEVKLDCADKIADVNYAGDDQAYHTCDIYIPKQGKKPFPVVIHIYGSAWFSNNSKGMADISTIVKALLEAGYAVVTPNHRSSMDAKFPAQINDIKAVVRFVRGEAKKYGFDTKFIATSGFSSGGHLASLTATTSGIKEGKIGNVTIDLEGNIGNYTKLSSSVNAACDWSGPIDLLNMDCGGKRADGASGPEEALLGCKADENMDLYRSLSPISYIDKNDPPLIVFHGKKDNVVPCCQGQELYDNLKNAGVKTDLTLVEEGGHGFNMYSDENLKKMVDFLNSARKKK
ncbi:MAG: alpha/beta hydrolase [Bacteroidales bacterium]|nr:alpha/beta hydrolase [Bacteroidales bacterium]